MASEANADSRRNLTVEPPPPPPPPIPKDVQGSDSSIPLSPQWLLPKPGDNKLGIEPHVSPHHGNHPNAGKASGNGENFLDLEKKRDVFRPSFYDPECGRRDRWRDEERETNTSIRRDRWREGDKELGDTRKIERWTDNVSRHAGDTRRAPSERWTDSGNRESNYDQRRESKWNTRWGPDDKESESWREKWSDSTRDSDGSHDKGNSHLASYGRDTVNHAKDTDKEGDHNSRSWRSNSSLTRGRGEAPHYLTTLNKQSPMFSYGRGRGENGPSVFSTGRGRLNTNSSTVNTGASRSYPLGALSDKSAGACRDSYTLRYSRMKLLDIYRMTDIKSHRISLEEFVEVPSLTLEESLEPLALSAPSSEESVVLKGIDKGDIVSSGTSQVSKDGSVGRTSVDAVASKQTKLGTRDDSSFVADDYKDEIINSTKADPFSHSESPSNEKRLLQHGPDPKIVLNQNIHLYHEDTEAPLHEGNIKKADESPARSSILESPSINYHVPLRSPSLGEHYRGSLHDWQDFSAEDHSKTFDMGWSHPQKDSEIELKNGTGVCAPYTRDVSRGQSNDDFHPGLRSDYIMKRQSSEILAQEREVNTLHAQEDPYMSKDKSTPRKFHSPEELSLYYRDPQGHIQGPFSGSDMIGWFEAGYFGIDLQVRLASAPPDAPFLLLGDVMPHLCMKARPPPGFGVARPSDVMEVSSSTKATSGNIYPGKSDIEVFKNGVGNRCDAATEAENRFLESLMTGKMSTSPSKHFPFAEGLQGYGRISSGNMPSVGGESGSDLNLLLSQTLSLDRQRSMPNTHPFWPGGETLPISSKNDIIPDSPVQQSKLLPTMGDTHPISPFPQQVDLLSILQAASEKSPSPVLNSGVPGWSNFSEVRPLKANVHTGMDIGQDNFRNQHFSSQAGFGVQQQRLQPQSQPSLPHLIAQHGDLSSSLVPPEKFPSSEIPQDPQTLSLLQQQYLLSQLQLHPQAVPAQLSLMDKLLLLKQQQQQQQEQQQKQLFLQQQLLLSQVLPGHQSHQYFGDAYGLLKASMPPGNAPVDHLGLHQMSDALHINQQRVPYLHDVCVSNPPDLPLQGPQDAGYTAGTGPSALLPHQIFDHTYPAEQDATVSQDVTNSSGSNLVSTAATQVCSFLSDTTEKFLEPLVSQKEIQVIEDNAAQEVPSMLGQTSANTTPVILEATNSLEVSEECSGKTDFTSISEQVHDMKISLDGIPKQDQVDLPSAEVVKSVEVREAKRVSEKKSKRQKNLRTVSATETSRGSAKTVPSQPLKQDAELDRAKIGLTNSEANADAEESIYGSSPSRVEAEQGCKNADATSGAQQGQLSSSADILVGKGGTVEGKSEEEVGTCANLQAVAGHRPWKSALGPKVQAKSLLEIQQEEQRKSENRASETATLVSPASTQPAPWSGVLANVDHRSNKDVIQGAISMQAVSSQNRKSQLHDLLAEEVLAKLNVGATEAPATDEKSLSMPVVPQIGSQVDNLAPSNDDFVEAKDTKKSRKKAAKAKATGLKASSPVASVDLSAMPSPLEKGKVTRQAMVEKEALPVPPAGPSLGDFVLWKSDQEGSAPAPAAWSTDLGKLQKPRSLRDIQKEQEKRTSSVQKQIPIPSPAKSQTNQGIRGSGSSWLVSGSSPSKAISTVQTKVVSPVQTSGVTPSQSKSRTEDDLFWGPLDQTRQETKRSDFPSLVSSNSWGVKGNTGKGAVVGSSHQKPSNTRSGDYSTASSPVRGHSIPKGRINTATKHSEAMDFREWCENELVKITGTRDMDFLEYCLKQPTSEAEMLLKENLGSLDRNHEFIDKFLNYKDFLSPEVIEIAFKAPGLDKVTEDDLGYRPSSDVGRAKSLDGDMDWDLDGTSKGGKKKGKKGKKVMPSAVLGFNVVSNRIMMGEIQSIDD